jgi:hypothetical protein
MHVAKAIEVQRLRDANEVMIDIAIASLQENQISSDFEFWGS